LAGSWDFSNIVNLLDPIYETVTRRQRRPDITLKVVKAEGYPAFFSNGGPARFNPEKHTAGWINELRQGVGDAAVNWDGQRDTKYQSAGTSATRMMLPARDVDRKGSLRARRALAGHARRSPRSFVNHC
jgi:hypothetical protein